MTTSQDEALVEPADTPDDAGTVAGEAEIVAVEVIDPGEVQAPGDVTAPVEPVEVADPVPAGEVAEPVAQVDPQGPSQPSGPAGAVEPEPVVLSGPPSQRLQQLGIVLPPPVAPVAAYVPAVRTGDLVFTSGQLPVVDGSLPLIGAVGDQPVDVSAQDAASLARICAINALAAVAALVPLDQVVRVVKVVGYVASAPGFTGQPGVVDGASRLLDQVFGEAGGHARSAVGVTALPLNTPVEVELVVEVLPAPAGA